VSEVYDVYVDKRRWFWVVAGVLCWRRFWDLIGEHGDEARFIGLTYFVLYVTILVARAG